MPLDDVIVRVLALPAIQWMLMPRPKAQAASAVGVPGLPSQPAPKPKPKAKPKAKAGAKNEAAADYEASGKFSTACRKAYSAVWLRITMGRPSVSITILGSAVVVTRASKPPYCYPDCFAADHTFLNHPA